MSLKKDWGKRKCMSIWVGIKQPEIVKERAKKLGISQSEYMRRLINRG